jgi:hypothetical protein
MSVWLKFEPRDLWVGVYWNVTGAQELPNPLKRRIDVYICLVPMLPIHIRWQG